MTKLSDSLRAAADRAPLDGASVPVDNVSRRVRVQRGLRTSANGLVGVGAVAVLGFGVATPFLGDIGAGASDGADALLTSAERPASESFAAEDTADEAAGTRLADWGTCGTYPLDWFEETGGFEAAVDGWGGGEFDGGDAVEVPVTVAPGELGEYTTSGPVAVVLWDGMVVSTVAPSTAVVEYVTVGDDAEPLSGTALAELVNCFNGEPLPASQYELLVSQQFTATTMESLTGTDDVATESLIGGDAVDPDSPAVEPTLLPTAVEVTETYRAVAPAVTFAVAGDPVEDPFAEFMPEPWTPPALPEGVMSPEEARALISASMTSSRWDMAAGTSRVVPSWGFDAAADEEGVVARYGCSWDGSIVVFPEESSTADLVDVDVSAPGSINVSYGWIVDGNPEVSVSVTNTSDYALPGFYGEPGVALYLVDSRGAVAAEGYPTTLARYGNVEYATDDLARDVGEAASAELLPAPAGDGYLESGDSISGDYVWRDVNGCWSEDGYQALEPGTYTLLSAQSMYFQSWGSGPVAEGVAESEASLVSDEAYGEDWLEVQVWTSHGTLRVTTS